MRKYYNAIDFEAFRKTIWHKMKENIHRYRYFSVVIMTQVCKEFHWWYLVLMNLRIFLAVLVKMNAFCKWFQLILPMFYKFFNISLCTKNFCNTSLKHNYKNIFQGKFCVNSRCKQKHYCYLLNIWVGINYHECHYYFSQKLKLKIWKLAKVKDETSIAFILIRMEGSQFDTRYNVMNMSQMIQQFFFQST